MRRKLLFLLTALFLLCFSALPANASLPPDYFLNKYVPRLQGTWYDLKGNPTFVFDGMSVNGCPIVGLYGGAGGGGNIGFIVRIVEKSGYRDLQLVFQFLSKDPSVAHQTMYYQGKAYRRTPSPVYYETIGGLGLGMSKDDVIERYGNPDDISIKNNRTFWMYSKLGMKLEFRYDELCSIRIYKYGDRRFDRTGFNCYNSLDEYREAYGLHRKELIGYGSYFGPNSIGHNEYLWFEDYPNSVSLNLFWS